MKKLSFFFVLLLLSSFVSAGVYTIPDPNGKYNNIGIQAYVLMDLNITLVNRGPFDKFILVNPAYSYTIIRNRGDKMEIIGSSGNTLYLDLNLERNMLNYYVGFWVKPYETVRINVRAVEAWPVNLTSVDYKNMADVAYGNRSAGYVNGTPYWSGVIKSPEESIFYETVVPQIILYPQKYYTLNKIIQVDGFIDVVRYEGKVTLVLKNVPNDGGNVFMTYFAVGMPVIFEGAETYDFTPEYTMMFSEYMKNFLPSYTNKEASKKEIETKIPTSKFNMYSLTNKLITGRSIKKKTSNTQKVQKPSFDFPVWIVWLGGDKLEITYRVKWDNRGKVSPFGGQKEKEIRFILDRRDIR